MKLFSEHTFYAVFQSICREFGYRGRVNKYNCFFNLSGAKFSDIISGKVRRLTFPSNGRAPTNRDLGKLILFSCLYPEAFRLKAAEGLI